MDYHEHELEDFMADPEFRNWVLKPNPSNHFFWKKWLAANPCKKRTVLVAREIILSFKYRSSEDIDLIDQGEILKSILAKRDTQTLPKKTSSSLMAFQAAACALIMAALTIGMKWSSSTEIVPTFSPAKLIVKENFRGQKSRITLPDGSTVYLNNNSRVSYSSSFVHKREIFLEGEAFFEVVKDPSRPFVVNSNGLLTKALGTSFNIRAPQGEKVEVGLVTGKILVSPVISDESGTKVIEDLGGKATYDTHDGKLDISSYPDMDFYQWTKRILVFKAASFKEVKETLENWYDVDISVRNLNRAITYTGKFPAESLESVLEQMAYAERFSFKMDKKDSRKITINFNN